MTLGILAKFEVNLTKFLKQKISTHITPPMMTFISQENDRSADSRP
jgi:hypothetical protein